MKKVLQSLIGLMNKSSRLAPALGVTKFITIIAVNLVTLCCDKYDPSVRISAPF
jgi:hypothetical protein